jgi:hypothetical protein
MGHGLTAIIIPFQHLCLFCFLLRVQSFSYLASRSRAAAADAFVANGR